MIGHIIQPAYSKYMNPDLEDKEILPATLSPELMQGLLRGQLGFNGVIVTDATTMTGFTIPMPREKSVPTTIAAGADIFLFSRNMKEDVAFMTKGLKDGIITKERLDEAVTRILALKASLKLYEKAGEYRIEEAEKKIGLPEYHQWARELADDSITLVKVEPDILPLTPERYPRLMYYPLETAGLDGFLDFSGKFKRMLENEKFQVTEFIPPKGFEGFLVPTTDFIGVYDAIVYFASISTRSNQTTVRIEWAPPLGANCPHYLSSIPTIFISVENPYHLQDVPRIRTYINGYTSSPEVLDMMLEKIMGRSPFKGVSPSDPFCGRWDTHLQ
jgi:beta-N-acetylhexosaminidase